MDKTCLESGQGQEHRQGGCPAYLRTCQRRTTSTRELLEPPPVTCSYVSLRYWRPTVSLDFRQGGQQLFHGNTRPVDKILDSIFGFQATRANVQREFGRCVCVRFYQALPPELLVLNDHERMLPRSQQVETLYRRTWKLERKVCRGDQVDGALLSANRGGECSSQTFWATVSVALIEPIADQFAVHIQPTTQGDNMLLSLQLRVPEHVPIVAE